YAEDAGAGAGEREVLPAPPVVGVGLVLERLGGGGDDPVPGDGVAVIAVEGGGAEARVAGPDPFGEPALGVVLRPVEGRPEREGERDDDGHAGQAQSVGLDQRPAPGG